MSKARAAPLQSTRLSVAIQPGVDRPTLHSRQKVRRRLRRVLLSISMLRQSACDALADPCATKWMGARGAALSVLVGCARHHIRPRQRLGLVKIRSSLCSSYAVWAPLRVPARHAMMGAAGELCIDSMAATRLDGARSRDAHDPIARSAFEGRALSESVSTLDLSQRHVHRGAET